MRAGQGGTPELLASLLAAVRAEDVPGFCQSLSTACVVPKDWLAVEEQVEQQGFAEVRPRRAARPDRICDQPCSLAPLLPAQHASLSSLQSLVPVPPSIPCTLEQRSSPGAGGAACASQHA